MWRLVSAQWILMMIIALLGFESHLHHLLVMKPGKVTFQVPQVPHPWNGDNNSVKLQDFVRDKWDDECKVLAQRKHTVKVNYHCYGPFMDISPWLPTRLSPGKCPLRQAEIGYHQPQTVQCHLGKRPLGHPFLSVFFPPNLVSLCFHRDLPCLVIQDLYLYC